MGMSLGINRGMALSNTGGSSFSPASLFAASEVGFWADVTPSRLWQDVARTNPVTAAGQSVGSWALSTASGFIYASQSTLASRPIYQTSGGLHWLSFDGSDDWLVTGTITPGADKAQVFAGVRKLSDAAAGAIVELSAIPDSNAGSFGLYAAFPANGYTFRNRGTAQVDAGSATTFTSPVSNVLTALGDISGDSTSIRVNGSVSGSSSSDVGTGNYLAYPLYIGRRGGTALPFNGNLYGLIVRFSSANLAADRISATERWMAGKTGVTLP